MRRRRAVSNRAAGCLVNKLGSLVRAHLVKEPRAAGLFRFSVVRRTRRSGSTRMRRPARRATLRESPGGGRTMQAVVPAYPLQVELLEAPTGGVDAVVRLPGA
jgi:hypothetical protein